MSCSGLPCSSFTEPARIVGWSPEPGSGAGPGPGPGAGVLGAAGWSRSWSIAGTVAPSATVTGLAPTRSGDAGCHWSAYLSGRPRQSMKRTTNDPGGSGPSEYVPFAIVLPLANVSGPMEASTQYP